MCIRDSPDDDDVDEGEDEDEASSSGQPPTLKEVLMISSAQLRSDHIRSCSDGGGDSSQASSMMQDQEQDFAVDLHQPWAHKKW